MKYNGFFIYGLILLQMIRIFVSLDQSVAAQYPAENTRIGMFRGREIFTLDPTQQGSISVLTYLLYTNNEHTTERKIRLALHIQEYFILGAKGAI